MIFEIMYILYILYILRKATVPFKIRTSTSCYKCQYEHFNFKIAFLECSTQDIYIYNNI